MPGVVIELGEVEGDVEEAVNIEALAAVVGETAVGDHCCSSQIAAVESVFGIRVELDIAERQAGDVRGRNPVFGTGDPQIGDRDAVATGADGDSIASGRVDHHVGGLASLAGECQLLGDHHVLVVAGTVVCVDDDRTGVVHAVDTFLDGGERINTEEERGTDSVRVGAKGGAIPGVIDVDRVYRRDGNALESTDVTFVGIGDTRRLNESGGRIDGGRVVLEGVDVFGRRA